ncbi:MAG TPA: GrpB family protein [Planctomycetota bacterium]|nr:GrpB family protein [Planctomycetota bacterium]
MSLGLPKGTVTLVDYDPEWPRLFEAERARLDAVLGPAAIAIEHIGSTAVPGLPAKPVLDIAAALGSLSAVGPLVAPLAEAGYRYLGEYGLPGRHFFDLGDPVTHHLHLVEVTSDHWRVWRLFRDYLRRHPDEAREYAVFKRGLAAKYAADREAYTRSKTDFVNGILAKAGRENGGPYRPPSTRLGEKGAV